MYQPAQYNSRSSRVKRVPDVDFAHNNPATMKRTIGRCLTTTSTTTSSRRRRVVVTGMGAITPLGNTLVDSWNRLLLRNDAKGQQEKSNCNSITTLQEALQWQGLSDEQYEHELRRCMQLPCQVAAPVKWYDNDPKTSLRTPRFVQFAIEAGTEAFHQANLYSWIGLKSDNDKDDPKEKDIVCSNKEEDEDVYQQRKERIGVCVGSAMSGVREIVNAARTIEQYDGKIRKLSPHFVPKVLSNSAAGRLSLALGGLQGPNHCASTACAAGSHALGDAMRCIQYGNADIMLAGGAESCIDPLSIAGFCRLRALSTQYGENPPISSRPFDSGRDGFVMGEGAAILVLEEYNHARQRGVPILAELCGYGLTGDAYHITSPDPNGKGAERAMRMGLKEATATAAAGTAEIAAEGASDATDTIFPDVPIHIGYVNAHATSTPIGDEIEARTIDRVFSSSTTNNRLFVSSTKGATGHLLGAAGAAEAAFTVLSLVHQIIPPTQNLESVDEKETLVNMEHVMEKPMEVPHLEAAISNSFGFGGTNSSLVFRRLKEE